MLISAKIFFSYDVDDLKGLVDANLRERQMAADFIASQIPDEVRLIMIG